MPINVIIPLAGEGSRFKEKNFLKPKPLVKAFKKTLIEISIKSLKIKKANYFFVIRKYKDKKLNKELINILKKYTSKRKIIQIKKPTSGPVSTCLKVKNIDQNKPLIIANCDQYLNWDPDLFFNFVKKKKAAGSVLTYRSCNKKNSFVALKKGKISNIVEKKAISSHALIGVHYWEKTKYFFQSSKKLILELKKNRKKREPYISETYKYLLKKKMTLVPYLLNKNEFFLIGTPIDYFNFKKKFKNKKNDKRYFI
ncbi:sugar phosphate nucleotidyltransferase [Candidatus Pelagibacter sp.]|nr:sugar phosphate nucleotidyltransferase [Candidatus Pelagibacter sp.]